MTEREFCYWLQGLLELSDVKTLNATQTVMIREHLKLVFEKVTPVYDYTILNPPGVLPYGTDVQITCVGSC